MIAQPIKISISLSSREPISFFNMSGTSSVVRLSNWHRSWHDSCPNFTNKQVHRTEMMQDTIRERVTRSRIVARALAKRRILPTKSLVEWFLRPEYNLGNWCCGVYKQSNKNCWHDPHVGVKWRNWYFTWIWLPNVSTSRAKMACCASMLSSLQN